MNTLNIDDYGAYEIFKENFLIKSCIEELGITYIGKFLLKYGDKEDIINIIKKEAIHKRRHDVLDRLFFAGLIYG